MAEWAFPIQLELIFLTQVEQAYLIGVGLHFPLQIERGFIQVELPFLIQVELPRPSLIQVELSFLIKAELSFITQVEPPFILQVEQIYFTQFEPAFILQFMMAFVLKFEAKLLFLLLWAELLVFLRADVELTFLH
jgi:hypothetical protein